MVPAYCLVIEAGSLSPVKLAMIGALRGKQRVVAARRVVLPAGAKALTDIPSMVAHGTHAGVCKPSARLRDMTTARPVTAISGETAA